MHGYECEFFFLDFPKTWGIPYVKSGKMTSFENYAILSNDCLSYGIIHLAHTQSFRKNENILPLDMYTYVCVSGGKKY